MLLKLLFVWLIAAVVILSVDAQGVGMVIKNFCPISIIAKCNNACGQTDVVLNTGQSVTWTGMPNNWNGRVYGHPILNGLSNTTYWDALMEFNFLDSGSFAGGCFFDMSYVDLYVLPVVIIPGASTCGAVGCNATYEEIFTRGCPKNASEGWDTTHFTGVGCSQLADFCKNSSNAAFSVCRRLDQQIQLCYSTDPYKSAGCSVLAGPPVVSTTATYAGTPGFNWASNGNIYNAALNRGMLSNVSSTNFAEWYNLYVETRNCEPQFNEYSRLIRDMCWGTVPATTGYPYAFSTDDVKNNGATAYCKTQSMTIVLCPGNEPGVTPPKPYPVNAPPANCASKIILTPGTVTLAPGTTNSPTPTTTQPPGTTTTGTTAPQTTTVKPGTTTTAAQTTQPASSAHLPTTFGLAAAMFILVLM